MSDLRNLHDVLCLQARELIANKGHDYNRKAQGDGDTLSNLRVARKMGLVQSDAQSVCVRLCDKMSRLSSLIHHDPKVKGESFKDTILDTINYSVYVAILYSTSEKVSVEQVAQYHEILTIQAREAQTDTDNIFQALGLADKAMGELIRLVAEIESLCSKVSAGMPPASIQSSVIMIIGIAVRLCFYKVGPEINFDPPISVASNQYLSVGN